MNRLLPFALRVMGLAIFVTCGLIRAQAQEPAAAPPKQEAAQPEPAKADPSKKEAAEPEANPFAPEPAPTLPPGMKGSDTNDPRAKLTPGLYDAGEASMGIKHLLLLKKPDAFQLGATDPDDPKVQKAIGQLGMSTMSAKLPKSMHLAVAP